MKKINILFALVLLAGFILSNTQGAFTTDYTGSTGLSGTSCGASSCHQGTNSGDTTQIDVKVMSANNIDITKTATGYTPGATYTVYAKLYVGNKVKAGFQCVPLTFSNNPIGTVTNTFMPSLITIVPDGMNRQYVSHTTAGTTSTAVISGGYATWKFGWVAPSTNQGAVFFHMVGNVTNNDGTSNGDTVKITTPVIQAPTAVHSVSKLHISLFPNPCSSTLYLNSESQQVLSLKICSAMGQVVKEYKEFQNEISVNELPSGFYQLLVETKEHEWSTTTFMKQ